MMLPTTAVKWVSVVANFSTTVVNISIIYRQIRTRSTTGAHMVIWILMHLLHEVRASVVVTH
jgi:hypothetical protein